MKKDADERLKDAVGEIQKPKRYHITVTWLDGSSMNFRHAIIEPSHDNVIILIEDVLDAVRAATYPVRRIIPLSSFAMMTIEEPR